MQKRNYTPGPAPVSMHSNLIRNQDRHNVHEQIDDFFGRNGEIQRPEIEDRTNEAFVHRFRITYASNQ